MKERGDSSVGTRDCGNGVYGLADDYLALLQGLDEVVRGWARELRAAPRKYPALIATDTLLRTDYYGSFPSQATFAAPVSPAVHAELKSVVEQGELKGKLLPPAMQLRPALCYHVYEELRGRVLDADLVVFTTFGSCFRHEETPVCLERQREFSMREIVFAGDPERIREHRVQLRDRSEELARSLGLDAKADVAVDPFFGTANRGRVLYQREQQLKWELLQAMSQSEPLAIASFNLHEEYFGQAFEIFRDEQRTTPASTGCIGWGYERWIAAVVDRHGAVPANWPTEAKKLVERGASFAGVA